MAATACTSAPTSRRTARTSIPIRPRRLLLNKQEIRQLGGKVDEKGLTLVPLEIYFSRGYAKLTLGVARGRKLHDKREALKRRVQEREAQRAMETQ